MSTENTQATGESSSVESPQAAHRKFTFEAWRGGRLIGVHKPVIASSEDEAWQMASIGLADYPPGVEITCREET